MKTRLATLWHAEFFSAKDFLRHAIFIIAFYTVAQLAGLREFTSFLSGTMGSVNLGWEISGLFGIGYILVYLAFVVLVPILILAAGILALWRKLLSPNDKV